MLSELSHLERRQSTSLNERNLYVVDKLKYALKNNPDVKFQREKNKVQDRVLNTSTDNCTVDCELMVSCTKITGTLLRNGRK